MIARLRRVLDHADLRRVRFWVQLVAFALLIYGGWAGIRLGQNLPTFSCGFNDPGRGGVCWLLPIQHQMAMPWKVLFAGAGIAVVIGFLTFVGWFLVLNKAWCGWICPLGTLQDWITALRSRLGIPAARYGEATLRRLSRVKYGLLALLILIPMGIGNLALPGDLQTPFCMICPGRTVLPLFNGDASHLAVDFSSPTRMILTALGMVVTGAFLAGAFFIKRCFCLFCPMSALHWLLSKPALPRLRKDGAKCTRCGDCSRVCDMQIQDIADDVTSTAIMRDDCILCLKCVAACPETGCLRLDLVRLPLLRSSESGFIGRMNPPPTRNGDPA
jgi:polyferredoxin